MALQLYVKRAKALHMYSTTHPLFLVFKLDSKLQQCRQQTKVNQRVSPLPANICPAIKHKVVEYVGTKGWHLLL